MASIRPTRSLLWLLCPTLVLAGACGSNGGQTTSEPAATSAPTTATTAVIDPGDGGDYQVTLDPADFVATVDNPYWPLAPGSRWVFEGDGEHIEVVVTEERKEILGIDATVVRDTVSDESGQVVEDTFDWYAQDAEGNVWYLGEDSTEYEDGAPAGTAGSWEAGVDGALPGIVMPAAPAEGDAYRQEFDPGNAEDLAEVRRVEPTLDTPTGAYTDVLVTAEWTPLEPDVVEEKYYAEGVGVIREEEPSPVARVAVDLVSFDPGR